MIIQDFSLENLFWISLCLALILSIAATIVVTIWMGRKRVGPAKGMLFAATTCVVVFVLSLVPEAIIEAFVDNTDQASAAAHATLNQLPQVDNIEVAAVRDTSFLSEVGGCCCAYGRFYLLLGTSLSASEALDLYTQKLQISGWTVEGKQYETSRGFIRGANEYINISYGGDGGAAWEWGNHPDYITAKSAYPILLNSRIDYLLPNRAECGH